MMIEVDTLDNGVILLSMDRIHKVYAHAERTDDNDDGLAVVEVDNKCAIVLKQSMVSLKRVLDGGGIKIIRG